MHARACSTAPHIGHYTPAARHHTTTTQWGRHRRLRRLACRRSLLVLSDACIAGSTYAYGATASEYVVFTIHGHGVTTRSRMVTEPATACILRSDSPGTHVCIWMPRAVLSRCSCRKHQTQSSPSSYVMILSLSSTPMCELACQSSLPLVLLWSSSVCKNAAAPLPRSTTTEAPPAVEPSGGMTNRHTRRLGRCD